MYLLQCWKSHYLIFCPPGICHNDRKLVCRLQFCSGPVEPEIIVKKPSFFLIEKLFIFFSFCLDFAKRWRDVRKKTQQSKEKKKFQKRQRQWHQRKNTPTRRLLLAFFSLLKKIVAQSNNNFFFFFP